MVARIFFRTIWKGRSAAAAGAANQAVPVDSVAPRLAQIAGLEDETGNCRTDLVDCGHGIAEREALCDEGRSEGGSAQPVGAGQTRRGEHRSARAALSGVGRSDVL